MVVRLPVAAVLVVACAIAAGCGGSSHNAAPPAPKPCVLTPAQKRGVAAAQADIRLLKQIQKPLHKFSDQGTPAQERVTGKFLADLGRVELPIDTRAHLIHLAKAAVGLCGLCFQGLEAEEPALAGRLGKPACG
jgi:hypothetical protein